MQRPNILRRERLAVKLDELRGIPLLVIHADAGYGKSTLLEMYQSQQDAVVYHMTTADNTPTHFLQRLSALVFGHSPENCGGEDFVIDETARLAHKLEQDGLSLVLEEYERVVPNAAIAQTVLRFSEHFHGRLLVLSRVRPDFALTRMLLNSSAALLTKQDLAFTADETAMLFEQCYHNPLSDAELTMLIQRIEGWPAGLHLVYEALKLTAPENRGQFWTRFMHSPLLCDYLLEEVVGTLPKKTQYFLYESSLFSEMEPNLLQEYMGLSDPGKILTRLTRENLFTISLDGIGSRYRYHNFFRQYLYQMLLASVGPERLKKKHAEVSALYAHNGQIDQAIAHAILADQVQEVPRLVNQLASKLDMESVFQLMAGWVERAFPGIGDTGWVILRRMLPISFYESVLTHLKSTADNKNGIVDPISIGYAHKYLGNYYFYTGHGQQSRYWLEKARDLFHSRRQPDDEATMCAMLALVCTLCGHPEEGQAHIARALTCVSDYESCTYRNLLIVKAELALADGNYPLAEQLSLQSMNIEQPYLIRNTVCLSALAVSCVMQGKREEGLAASQRALAAAEQTQSPIDFGFAYNRRAIVLRACGKQDAARGAIEQAIPYLKEFRFLLARALLIRADLAFEAGEENAELLLREMRDFWEKQQYLLTSCEKANAPFLFRTHPEWFVNAANPKQEPAALVIRVLGNLEVTVDGKPNHPASWGRDPARRIFLYLLMNRSKPVRRDVILEALWPEGNPIACAKRLSVALHTLKTQLPGLVDRQQDFLVLRLPENHYCDLESYERLSDEALKTKKKSLLFEAVQLYRGDLLEEYAYDEFLETAREQLRNKQCQLLMDLGQCYRTEGAYDDALLCYQKAQTIDPLLEEPVGRSMEILLYKGEPGIALAHYHHFYAYVQEELGISPSQKLRSLFNQINATVE